MPRRPVPGMRVTPSPTTARAAWQEEPARAGWRVAASWGLTLALSTVPLIVIDRATGAVPGWALAAQLAIAAAFTLACLAVRAVRPLWRFGVVMTALVLLTRVVTIRPLSFPAVQAALGGSAFDRLMQPQQTERLVVAILMVGLLLLLGFGVRRSFLLPGDLHARIRPVAALGFPRADPWIRFGAIWGIGIAVALGVVQFLIARPSSAALAALVPLLPSVLVYAGLNALSEEVTYRAAVLAPLEPAVGSANAMWQTAFFFGVAHYYGVPGGLLGATLSIFMGWILSKAMLETRGLLWPWTIHFLSDVVIFGFIAMATVG